MRFESGYSGPAYSRFIAFLLLDFIWCWLIIVFGECDIYIEILNIVVTLLAYDQGTNVEATVV